MSNPNITLTLTANRVIVIYSNTFRLLIHRENAIFYDTQWRLCLMQCFIVFKNHTREQIQWVDWLIGSIICEFEKEIAKKNWVHVIWCKSTQLASVARWSQRTPFTSEVAGSIPSENVLNVTRTQCFTHVKRVIQRSAESRDFPPGTMVSWPTGNVDGVGWD